MIRVILILLLAIPAQAANWCIRSGASGSNNGVDWNNAWTNFQSISWAAVKPGDTLWLAGGKYSDKMQVGANGQPTSRISICRVQSTDLAPASLAGWDPSFDSTVIIAPPGLPGTPYGIEWDRGPEVGNFVTIDGRLPRGILFQVVDAQFENGIRFFTGSQGVVITNCEFAGPGGASGYPFTNDTGAIYLGSDGGGLTRDVLISHCVMHGLVGAFQINAVSNIVIEHCRIYDIWARPPSPPYTQLHDNVAYLTASTNVTFRYCDVSNWGSEGIFLTGAGTPPQSLTNPPNRNIKVYGNIFHDMAGGMTGGVGRFIENRATTNQVFVYNNTVANAWAGIRLSDGYFSSDSQARNNVFYNIALGPNPAGTTNFDQDYTVSDGAVADPHGFSHAGFPFVSLTDYHLGTNSAAIAFGLTLGAEYSTDPDGNIRVAPWDAGAFVHVTNFVFRPTPPGGLRIIASQ